MVNGIGLLLSAVAGVCAFFWMPLASFVGVKEGLIAFLGFLSAALIQVIPVTANFLQGDDLTPEQTLRLNRQLERQQIYWLGLLAATVVCLVAVICVSGINVHALAAIESKVPWDKVISGGLALLLAFVFSRMLGIFSGVMSLHRLRAELILKAAQERAAAKTKKEMSATATFAPVLPPGYGEVLAPEQNLH
jgi:hypothetical protein